ncbi:MAG: alpha/beta fold hydrolase [Deltaproteobacteria bacterium]|nr:alpha/beta fold hydrolase [Deltaproteobacteria bacterium]
MKFKVEKVEFHIGKVNLVGDLYFPEDPHNLGAVILHPHPVYGGDRHNNVTTGIAEGLADSGFPALTFDFRGAGESSGIHTGGADEVADVQAALALLESRAPKLDRTALVGYSFGAYVASLAIESMAVESEPAGTNTCSPWAVVCVAPPVSMFDMRGLQGFLGPMLLLAGDMDQFGPLEDVTMLAEYAGAELQRIQGGDHFLRGREPDIARRIVDFLDRSAGL